MLFQLSDLFDYVLALQKATVLSLTGTCSCGTLNASNCIAPLLLNNGTVTVDGMFIGCLPLSSLLRSSLSCFYNETCIRRVQVALQFNIHFPTFRASPLSVTMVSEFKPDTPIENIINSLMVETWTSTVDYLAYFQQCQAKTCTYSIAQRNNVPTIAAKLLGLCELSLLHKRIWAFDSSLYVDGGITVTMRMATRLLFKIYRKIVSKLEGCRARRVNDFHGWVNLYSPWIAFRCCQCNLLVELSIWICFCCHRDQFSGEEC